MSGNPWLACLKDQAVLGGDPTEPTKANQDDPETGFVGFVGAHSGAEAKTRREGDGGFVGFVGTPAGTSQERSDAEPPANDSQHERLPAGAEAFAQRVHRFTERGMDPRAAQALAERLALRDADLDDRRTCVECSHLGLGGRCIAAANGRIPGATAFYTPVTTILQRCEGFGLRKGLQ
jgi:hypothetical protein